MSAQLTTFLALLISSLWLCHSAAQAAPKRKRPPARSLYSGPFAKRLLRLGRRYRKSLNKDWSMEWSLSRLRDLRWLASSQEGFRIRFVHKRKRVAVPVPFPNAQGGRKTKVVKLRCSLHFYPRKGRYQAQTSPIVQLPPAKVRAVLRHMIIFQPDRFQAMEYPCPEMIKRFLHFVNATRPGVSIKRKLRTLFRRKSIKEAKRYPYHVKVLLRRSSKTRWRAVARRAGVRTVLLETTTPLQHNITIYNK